MAVCNTFKKLSKNTGTFLTFGQYVEDLTAWKVLSNYYNIVPSKFITIDCQTKQYDNRSFPQAIQELFENGCACFKNDNDTEFEWNPSYAKTLFWNTMFDMGILKEDTQKDTKYINGINYIGDINIQSYDEVDGMGYSEIYCHIPNEASSYKYSFSTETNSNSKIITRNYEDLLEGFQENELNGAEKLTILPYNDIEGDEYKYNLENSYKFSWDDVSLNTIKLSDKSFNINLIVVLYDIMGSNNQIMYSGIPMGIYITGLFESGKIQNPITKYVANEDIYNSGTSYGLRICSRFVAVSLEENYIIKEVTCEDSNHADLSRVLSQLSISQNKMDEILSNKYVTDQNYKNLLAIFKNSKTNVPYIKRVNNNDYWFVNGKMLGPSISENLFEPYSNSDIENMINLNITKYFQILPKFDGEFIIGLNGTQIFKEDNEQYSYLMDYSQSIFEYRIGWNTKYEGIDINPHKFTVNDKDYTDAECLDKSLDKTHSTINPNSLIEYKLKAEYNNWNDEKTIKICAVYPAYFGVLNMNINNTPSGPSENQSESLSDIINKAIKDNKLSKIIQSNINFTREITTNMENGENAERICYIYPQDKGKLTSITDLYGKTYTIADETSGVNGEFIIYELELPVGNNNIKYYAYIGSDTAYINDYTLNFNGGK